MAKIIQFPKSPKQPRNLWTEGVDNTAPKIEEPDILQEYIPQGERRPESKVARFFLFILFLTLFIIAPVFGFAFALWWVLRDLGTEK